MRYEGAAQIVQNPIGDAASRIELRLVLIPRVINRPALASGFAGRKEVLTLGDRRENGGSHMAIREGVLPAVLRDPRRQGDRLFVLVDPAPLQLRDLRATLPQQNAKAGYVPNMPRPSQTCQTLFSSG